MTKEQLESLKLFFPLRFDVMFMYIVGRDGRPVFESMGHRGAHSQMMILRGVAIKDWLNSLAEQYGLMPKPVEAQGKPISVDPMPIVVPSGGFGDGKSSFVKVAETVKLEDKSSRLEEVKPEQPKRRGMPKGGWKNR